jgi:hypothetical protein
MVIGSPRPPGKGDGKVLAESRTLQPERDDMQARTKPLLLASTGFRSVPEFLHHFRAEHAVPVRRSRRRPLPPPPLWRRCGSVLCDIALLIFALLVGLRPNA